jgi:ATP-binding cassette subfamily B protein
MDQSSFELLRRAWRVISRRRKWQIGFLGILMLIGTFMDMLTLGAVLPFLAVLMDPAAAFQRPAIAKLTAMVGITSPEMLLEPLTMVFVGIVLTAGMGKLILQWSTHHMSFLIGTDLSSEVFKRTLYQPFSVHVARNSSQLIATITKKIATTTHVFQHLLQAITSLVSAAGIVTALLMVDPVVASLSAMVFGSGYLLIARVTRRRLLRNGKRIKEASVRLVKALQEGLGGIRDVLLDGTQATHVSAYRRVDRPLRRATANNGFIAGSPRIVMEAFGISAIALLAFVLSQREGGARQFLPVLGVLAIGAQRLLPAFQHVFTGYASFVGHQASVAEIVKLMEQPLPEYASQPLPPPLDFQHGVAFEHVSFSYTGSPPWVLEDVNLVIEKGSRVGFVGSTGSGKSTALDLLMGLLTPTQGQILADGKPISDVHGRAWQRTIAHVPQAIYLSDATMAENIAFGVVPEKIDMERVKQVARTAHIAEFIESQPLGYKTEVGERGVRLSGGQRQRIGIARALYKNASVLVFDEATSALDNSTERDLMDAIEGLSRELTILMIAHRLTTVERCDKIVVIEAGRIVAADTHQKLLETNEHFRSLAK